MDYVGRASEISVMEGLVRAVQTGQGRALVVRGEAGLAKSALIDQLARSAPGLRTPQPARAAARCPRHGPRFSGRWPA